MDKEPFKKRAYFRANIIKALKAGRREMMILAGGDMAQYEVIKKMSLEEYLTLMAFDKERKTPDNAPA